MEPLYKTFQAALADKLEIFCSTLNSAPKDLYTPIGYTLGLSAKRLRPLLTLISCDLFQGNAHEALEAAMAVELFHNFSLIHDDIMDNAPLRRGNPTVHTKWNSAVAILSGDALLVKAYQTLGQSKLPPPVIQDLTNVFNKVALLVCEGQAFDMAFETQSEVSIPEYLKMIELKTAVLLGGALQMGAIVAGASTSQCELMYAFGTQLGIAFQLQDDLLDTYGDGQKFGKQQGGDILANKKTYLLLKALEGSVQFPQLNDQLQALLQGKTADPKEKIEKTIAIYDQCAVKEATISAMQGYYATAMDMLKETQASPEKIATIKHFIAELMQREV